MGFSLLGCIPYSGEVHRFLLLVAVFILPGCIPYSGEVHRYSLLVTGFLLSGCIPNSGEVHRYSLLVAGFILPGFSPVYRLTSGCIPKYSWVHPEVGINPSVLSEKSRQNASRFQKWIAVHLSTIRDPSRHFFYSVPVLHTCLPAIKPKCLLAFLSTSQPANLKIHLPAYLSNCLPADLLTCQPA